MCLDYNGDVAKFCGDALLCIWERDDYDVAQAFHTAKECAIEMLRALEVFNKEKGSNLQIHGGLAFGSILHFHLGSPDDVLRWYLVAGEAVSGATGLVDVAMPGEMLCLEEKANPRNRLDTSALLTEYEHLDEVYSTNTPKKKNTFGARLDKVVPGLQDDKAQVKMNPRASLLSQRSMLNFRRGEGEEMAEGGEDSSAPSSPMSTPEGLRTPSTLSLDALSWSTGGASGNKGRTSASFQTTTGGKVKTLCLTAER